MLLNNSKISRILKKLVLFLFIPYFLFDSLQAGGSGEWLGWLSVGELRKLFLGALRGVCDRDLRSLIPRAPKLAQLDLLGVRAVTADICDS